MIVSRRHKNSKFMFYARGILGMAVPRVYFRSRLGALLSEVPEGARAIVEDRVQYYMKSDADFVVSPEARTLSEIPSNRHSAYYFDLRRVVRHFPDGVSFDYKFADIAHVPSVPSFVKSRPLGIENANSVILKLNAVRHFVRIKDRYEYEKKTDGLVWRGISRQPQRAEFLRKFRDRPGFDVGQVRSEGDADVAGVKPFMSIDDQLRYKFVMSIEGNDVATNLKWIMASNSVCFMRAPRHETWFAEGRLIPGEHFVLVEDDYSDVEEKLHFFLEHPDESRRIIANANAWVAQFHDARLERLISLKVLEKYFRHTGQM